MGSETYFLWPPSANGVLVIVCKGRQEFCCAQNGRSDDNAADFALQVQPVSQFSGGALLVGLITHDLYCIQQMSIA